MLLNPHEVGDKSEEILVRLLRPGEENAWRAFLDSSETGTLFHDLRFLAYHPAGRHRFHHLVFWKGEEIVALLPGGLVTSPEGDVFTSPVGASIGGFVLADCNLSLAARLVESLIAYTKNIGWHGLDMTLPPPIYNGKLASLSSFMLSRAGFTLANRWACYVLRLQPKRPGGAGDYFRSRTARYNLRTAQKRGAEVWRKPGMSLLPQFLPLFDQTFARHGVPPTHSHAELADISERFPDRITYHISHRDCVATGGTCLITPNARVTTALYTCTSDAHKKDHGALVAIADAIDDLATRGVEWYDLGPSADHERTNFGVVDFKESLGAEHHLRERWTRFL